jgi:hypothetical protein
LINFFFDRDYGGLTQPFYINAQKSSRIQYKFLEDIEGEDLADQGGHSYYTKKSEQKRREG